MSSSYIPISRGSTQERGRLRRGAEWVFGGPDYNAPDADTIMGRAFQGITQLPDTLFRGLAQLPAMVYQDLEVSAAAALEGLGLETEFTRRSLERGAQGPEMIGGLLRSGAGTVSTAADLTYLPRVLSNVVESGMGRDVDIFQNANQRFMERGREFSADPSMFLLEHVGNAALFGGIAAKPAQLGMARARGVVSTEQALQGLRPLAGRESRATARHYVADQAEAARTSGSRVSLPQAVHLADNAVNHPYRTALRNTRDSVPGRLVRTPLERSEALARSQRSLRRRSGEHTLGPLDLLANEVGLSARWVSNSDLWQHRFGVQSRTARQITEDLNRSETRGMGEIAERTGGRVSTEVGRQQLQRRYDPSRVERNFVQDVRNLSRRTDIDTSKYKGLIKDIDSLGRPGRVAGRAQFSPEQLISQIDRVVEEAQLRAVNNPSTNAMSQTIQEILPNTDPQGLYLMGLDLADIAAGRPQGTLSGILSDYVQMDRFSDLNRRAQVQIQGSDSASAATPERFRLPQEALDVDINALPQGVQRMFYGAAEEHRIRTGTIREPALIEVGEIPEAGTRVGLAGDEPTRFPTTLEDMPLDSATRDRLRKARESQETQREVVRDVGERLDELRGSGIPERVRVPGEEITFREGRPTRASMDRAWRTTPTGAAIKRWRDRLGTEKERLLQVSSKLHELERSTIVDPSQAPSSARNLLTYANEVAPKQASLLRSMAADGNQGTPRVLNALADELDNMPRTLEHLNSAEVYVAYLRDVKKRNPDGSFSPGSSRPIDTRRPLSTQRRQVSRTMDIEFERDFRTRSYWQDAEFQKYFMKLEADNWVRKSGLARTGRTLLEESGEYSSAEIKAMTNNQAQQALERMGVQAYNPETLFGTGRKPPLGVSPLDNNWIAPHISRIITKSLEGPGTFERVIMEGIYDPIINAWKTTVLPLRFAWQVNNYGGSAILSMMRGKVSPLDYPKLMRSSYRAVRNWNRGLVGEIEIPLHGAYRAELRGKLGQLDSNSAQAANIRRMLEDNVIRLDNSILNDISSRGLVRGDYSFMQNSSFMHEVTGPRNIIQQINEGQRVAKQPTRGRSRAGEWKQTGREFIDFAYHVNETVENFHRAMVYMDSIGKGFSHPQALGQVVAALGDYSKLSRFERRVMRRAYPFYAWMQHMARVIASSTHPSNIQSTVIWSHMLNILGEPNEIEELLPDWAGGHVYVGDAEDGTPKFLSTRGLNPFLDVFDPLTRPNLQGLLRPASPFIQIPYEQLSGTDVLREQPFTSAPGSDLTRPPLREYFFKNIPYAGAARDIVRDFQGEPLTRYGTGEAIYYQGASDNRSSLQTLQRLMGANIQALDVEGMANREKMLEYQQELSRRRYESQQMQHERRQQLPRSLRG